MCRLAGCAALLLVALATEPARADERAAIQAQLARATLEPGTTEREIKAFVTPRIIAPPVFMDQAAWAKTAEALRRDMLEQIVFRGRAAEWRDAACQVVWLDTLEAGAGYRIRKFRYEALPGMWIPGLLYEPDTLADLPAGKKVPLALHVNGHAPEGKAVDYKQIRSINLAKRGMLVLNVEWFGMGQLRTPGFAHGRMNQLDLCGASGLAPFYLAMQRALDLGLKLDRADAKRVAVSGLSGGGWQTILISSLDERVTLANPVAGYGSYHTNIGFGDMGDSEQAPTDMALLCDYTHLTAMRAPRPTLLTYNAGDDCCFKSGHTLGPLLSAARPMFAATGAEANLRSHINHVPGTHNFDRENREQLYAFIGDQFYAGDSNYVRTEIPCQDELCTAEELNVPLPQDNVDFNGLARALIASAPGRPKVPTTGEAGERYRVEHRAKLKALLRVPNFEVADVQAIDSQKGVTTRRIKLGEQWTLPVTDFAATGKTPKATLIVLADSGRASLAELIEQRLAQGDRVLAVDPLLIGESKVKAQDPDYTYALFLATVGERPLGIQAAQLMALARWAAQEQPGVPVVLRGIGPRAATAALVATGLEPAIGRVELRDALPSFRQLIEQNVAVEAMLELFPFGLLAQFDVAEIAALAVPREVVFEAGEAVDQPQRR